MARKRVIYQSEGLYVGPTSGATHNETLNSVAGGSITRTGVEPAQLHRIQSINYGFDIPRQDVKSRVLAGIKRQEFEELKNLINQYNLNKSAPLQVAGDDTVEGFYAVSRKFNRIPNNLT